MVILLLALLATGAVAQDSASVSPDRVNRIAALLIAPCCWSQTAEVHQSDAAKTVKEKIRVGILAGKTDEEIVQEFIDEYGERILSVPRPRGFNLTLWVFLALVIVVSAAGLSWYVKRIAQYAANRKASSVPVEDSMNQRIEKELKSLN
jgi:cytochrome c-type biogenesis protein CcmH